MNLSRSKVGYKLVGSPTDYQLRHFFKAFSEGVDKRIKEAREEELRALAKNGDVVFNYAS